jgi:hypothetical protein
MLAKYAHSRHKLVVKATQTSTPVAAAVLVDVAAFRASQTVGRVRDRHGVISS